MTSSAQKGRYLPLIILALVAALVVVLAMWATDRVKEAAAEQGASAGAAVEKTGKFHWKIVTTWPKNFPGLGSREK
jgi:hypothetical protein